jgi:ATP-dependent Lon protease
MLHWLFFTETFLFSNPKAVASRSQQPQQTQTLSTSQDITESSHYKSLLPLEVFRSEDGLWMDFNLAQKLLSFLDVLTNLNPTSKSETSKMMSISNIFTASFAGFPLTSNTNQQNKDIQSALPPAIVTELEQHAQRFYLNLVLHSIKENGGSVHSFFFE